MGNGMARDTAVETESFCGRLGNACIGVVVGLCLFVGSIFILGWNEFNYVHNQDILFYLKESVSTAVCVPESMQDGDGIWVSCPITRQYDFARNLDIQGLGIFGPDSSLESVQFQATSQIWQWHERKTQVSEHKTPSGTKVKEYQYTYYEDWSSEPVDSSRFYCISSFRRGGCVREYGNMLENTGTIPAVLHRTLSAPDNAVTMGSSYGMNGGLLGAFTALKVPSITRTGYTNVGGLGKRFIQELGGGTVLFARSHSGHSIGDVKTTFSLRDVQTDVTLVSVVAKQARGPTGAAELVPWDTHKSGTMGVVNWATEGSHSLNEMVDDKAKENGNMVIILRLVGFLAMFLGLNLVTAPIAVAPQIVPCVGDLIGEVVGCALCCMNLAISLMLSLVVVGVAWMAARPLIGSVALLLAAVCLAAAVLVRRRAKSQRISARSLRVDPISIEQANSPIAGGMAGAHARLVGSNMTVQCPEGASEGAVVQVQGPDGRQYQVTVPRGVRPGQLFDIAL